MKDLSLKQRTIYSSHLFLIAIALEVRNGSKCHAVTYAVKETNQQEQNTSKFTQTKHNSKLFHFRVVCLGCS